jgi:hypothetical protein
VTGVFALVSSCHFRVFLVVALPNCCLVGGLGVVLAAQRTQLSGLQMRPGLPDISRFRAAALGVAQRDYAL